MKLVVFGANGATGQLLTKQALAEGHMVTAVTRHPDTFPIQHEGLHVMGGDVYDCQSVEQAIMGQDAVLSTLGVPFTREPISIYSKGMAHIIEAMSKFGVRRLICVSSSAADPQTRYHDSGGGFFFEKVMKPMVIKTIGRTTYADMYEMETMVRNSNLDWTIIRPSGLFETASVTPYKMAETSIRGQYTSRADLADCMLRQATSKQYMGKVMAVATVAEQPKMIQMIMKEAFKTPAR